MQDNAGMIIDFDFGALYPTAGIRRRSKLYWMIYDIKDWMLVLFRRIIKPFRYLSGKISRILG